MRQAQKKPPTHKASGFLNWLSQSDDDDYSIIAGLVRNRLLFEPWSTLQSLRQE